MIQFISCLFKEYIENESDTFMELADISFRQIHIFCNVWKKVELDCASREAKDTPVFLQIGERTKKEDFVIWFIGFLTILYTTSQKTMIFNTLLRILKGVPLFHV